MYTPDYDCELLANFEEVHCNYFQDIAITHYYFIGYLEIFIVAFIFYVVVVKILWNWLTKSFFLK